MESKDDNQTPPRNAGPSPSAASTSEFSETYFNADAQLMSEFEKSGKSFDYLKSVPHAARALSSDEKISDYLSKIQRGSFVQSVGCTLAITGDFKIIAHSENCYEMLGVPNLVGPGLIGTDFRNLFTLPSVSSLLKALAFSDLSFQNPIWVYSSANRKPFYAILHVNDVSLIIDLEPAKDGHPSAIHAGAVQSQKVAVRAISRLQSLPRGSVEILCDTVVEEVILLTGYDRVMVYKFHDDDHGEVISEIRRSNLEPYLGLHYPATDIPQVARFFFKQNRVRMICDCNSEPVKIIQSPELDEPLCLINSTLRAPHDCHVEYMINMGSVASLVLAIIVNDGVGSSPRLWGLVVCHHTAPRHIPFPLRNAAEFLVQAFSLQLQVELQMAARLSEKRILRMQTLLCSLLLRNTPHGIITQSPSIMDLVKCDGAALYYKGKSWLVGVTPTESQVKDIVGWLMTTQGDYTGMSTECLADTGYPEADSLGDAVCGMAAARINSSDFLFWFRSHTAKEVKWGGAKHHPEDDDGVGKMHPRTSFSAFLEVVKGRSLPWEPAELDAVYSLQLIMRDAIWKIEEGGGIRQVRYSKPEDEVDELASVDEPASVTVGMVRLIESGAAPIFGVDSSGLINGWNAYMCELTGLNSSKAFGKLLVDLVHEDSCEVVEALITKALQGREEKNVEVKLVKHGENMPNSFVYLRISSCMSRDYQKDVVGVCFVGQDITAEKTASDKFIRLKGDYESIIESVNPLIPPIFASDENAHCSEWNAVMENLTGYTRSEMVGKLLPGEVFGSLCKLKDENLLTKFSILLHKAISGYETPGKLRFGFYDQRGEFVEMHLTASKKVDKSGHAVGCLCFLQTIVVNNEKDDWMDDDNNELAYLREEMKNPLRGLSFTYQLLESSSASASASDDQKQLLDARGSCERQILSIIDNAGLGNLEVGEMVLKEEEFLLGSVINAIVSQAMILLREKNLHLVNDIPEEIKNIRLRDDEIKLQSALSDFLVCIANYTHSDGWVEIKVSHVFKLVKDGIEFVHLQFRMVHPGQGLPQDLIEDMFGMKSCKTRQGVALNVSLKIVSKMKGDVCYIRDQNENYFRVNIELKAGRDQD